jgi:hypothetical protein
MYILLINRWLAALLNSPSPLASKPVRNVSKRIERRIQVINATSGLNNN